VPLHLEQVLCEDILPNGVCLISVMTPDPLHSEQVFLDVPGLAPDPLHTSHSSFLVTFNDTFLPKAASLKSILIDCCISAPLTGPLLVEPPNPPNPPNP